MEIAWTNSVHGEGRSGETGKSTKKVLTKNLRNIYRLVGFGRACAPVRCAHPSFWAHCHPKRGAARPPPPSHCCFLFDPPKYITKLFSFHWTTEAMRSPAPRPDRSFADPSGNCFGVIIIYRCDHTPQFFSDFSFFFCFWIFPFGYSLLFLLSFSISSYSSLLILLFLSLLILLVGAIICLFTLLLLYFKLLINTHIRHSEGFFEGE